MIKLLLVLALNTSYSHDVELNQFNNMQSCINSMVELSKTVKIKNSDIICLSVQSSEVENPFN